MISIKINDFEVVRDGSLVVNASNSISFTVADLEFTFIFQKDETGEKKLVHNPVGDKKVITSIYNFDNSLGTGYSDPIEFATLNNGEKLYLLFAVYSIAESLKIFHYTWLKRNIQGGK